MRFVREIIADRLSGGVLALLVAFMMMLDGAIGAHAQAAMAAGEHALHGQIICSSGGGTDGASAQGRADDADGDGSALAWHAGHGGAGLGDTGPYTGHGDAGHERPQCCSAACHFAAQFAAVDLPRLVAPQWPLPPRGAPVARAHAMAAPQPVAHFSDARGPPSL